MSRPSTSRASRDLKGNLATEGAWRKSGTENLDYGPARVFDPKPAAMKAIPHRIKPG